MIKQVSSNTYEAKGDGFMDSIPEAAIADLSRLPLVLRLLSDWVSFHCYVSFKNSKTDVYSDC